MHRMLRQDRGVTLLELLVALTLSTLLIAGLYRTFLGQQKTYYVTEQVVDLQQNVRTAVGRMVREIRMAGFGNVDMALPAAGGSAPSRVSKVTFITPDSNSIMFYTAFGDSTATIAFTPAEVTANNIDMNNTIKVSSKDPLHTDTVSYLSIGGLESHKILQVEKSTVKGYNITFEDNLIYKVPEGTSVFPVRQVSYQLVVEGGTSRLKRDDGVGGGRQPLADNIDSVQFGYLDAAGKPSIDQLRMVSVTASAKTDAPDPQMKTDGGFRKRQIASTVQIRNMGDW